MKLFLYFISTLLYISAFPNFDLSIFAWACLVPLVLAIDREKDVLSVIKNSFLCGWLIFLGSMYWIAVVKPGGWLGYILVTFYMSLYIAIFGIVRFFNKNFLFTAVSWTALEFIRGNLLGGIPWLLLGSSQYNFLPLIQISNIIGVYGVSFIVALFNTGLADLTKRRYISILISLLVLIGTIIYGRSELARNTAGEKIKVGIIQPNVSQEVKWDPSYTEWMLDCLEKSTKNLRKIDLAVWPETAVPEFSENIILQERIESFVKEINCDLVLGSQGLEGRKYFNSAFVISNKGEIVGEYRKIHLVPFGEFVPFKNIFPFLKYFTPIEDGFTAGNAYNVFSLQRYSCELSALICFEDIFPNLARQFVKRGANILVNITNDGWFGKTNAVYQHAYLSVFRAVENSVPLIRATNTGLSCFIDQNGRMYSAMPFTSLNLSGEILVSKRNTFYTKYGDIFGWVCVVVFLWIGGNDVRRIRKKFKTA